MEKSIYQESRKLLNAYLVANYNVLGFYVDEDDAYYYNYPCWRLSLLNTKTNVWRNMDWRLL